MSHVLSTNGISRAIAALTIIYVVLLSYLTLAPDPWWIFGSTGKSAEQAFDTTLADYVQHALAYSVLGLLLAAKEKAKEKGSGTFCRNGPEGASHKRCLTPFSFGLCHAVGTECLQYWIPPRTCCVVDGLANVIGLTVGWCLLKRCQEPFYGTAQRVLRTKGS